MVENLSKHYGDQICETDFGDSAADPTPFHSFPTVDALAANPSALEKRLRSLGFGYRAGYIAKTATSLQKKGGRDFLLKLREADYEDAREELLELSGIGPKVHIRYYPEKTREKNKFSRLRTASYSCLWTSTPPFPWTRTCSRSLLPSTSRTLGPTRR